MAATLTPMFPLGTVLLPGAVLPLHVFEPRYRTLTRRCLDEDIEFGVVLITHGHEVGGGDARSDIGCLARIDNASEAPDGRWHMVCVGTERIRVEEWHADDPYPVATVEPWPDSPHEDDLSEWVGKATVALRRTLALCAEAGLSVAPATVELSSDPIDICYQAASLAPLGDLDTYNILAAETTKDRLRAVIDAVEGAAELIEMQLR